MSFQKSIHIQVHVCTYNVTQIYIQCDTDLHTNTCVYFSIPFSLHKHSKFFVLCEWLFWRRQWHPTPVLLPGKSHGWRSLVGCCPWGRKESDTTERLHFHFSLSCIGEGNGTPLQYSCLENPRDGGAWWAAVYGVARSWTQLRRLSSSSSSSSGFSAVCLFLISKSSLYVNKICIFYAFQLLKLNINLSFNFILQLDLW